MRYFKLLLAVLACLTMLGGTASADWKPGESSKAEGGDEIQQTLDQMRKEYPAVDSYLEAAYAYAVFPEIKKAGFGIGGAQGYGTVFQGEEPIGKVRLRQLTLGLQGGLQAYSELIFFKDEATFESFKSGETELGAQASAVVMRKGAAESVSYDEGLAVFTLTQRGLMYEATVGGQRLKYEPL